MKTLQKDFTFVKDSGVREEFDSGSKRDSRAGKGRFDLLPARAMRRLAKHFENGAVKYGDNNWQKGQPISRYLDSAIRHIFCYLVGMDDEDHLVAGAWNLMCACETEERCLEGSLDPKFNDMLKYSYRPIEAPKYPVRVSIYTEGFTSNKDVAPVYVILTESDIPMVWTGWQTNQWVSSERIRDVDIEPIAIYTDKSDAETYARALNMLYQKQQKGNLNE